MDWYPWGEEALARAHELDRPIFLSIGYAACHWCHVMERESFEDEATAADLNEHFVAIKVDREERPDLDAVYMDAVQALTGQGGWPMSVFLTPDGRPFYGGTYFPDQPRHGMPSFRQVLARPSPRPGGSAASDVEEAATAMATRVRAEQDLPSRLLEALAHEGGTETEPSGLGPPDQPRVGPSERFATAVHGLRSSFDARHGGWGGAPKFPQPMVIEFLLREHLRTGAPEPRDMALRTLDAMADGGIYDHLGGGFARYSTDAQWLVAPLREDALRQRPAGARLQPRLPGDGRRALRLRGPRDARLRGPRAAPPAGRRLRRQPGRRHGRRGGPHLHLAGDRRSARSSARTPRSSRPPTTFDRAGNWEGRTILRRVRDDTSLAVEFERPRDEIREALTQARVSLLRRRDQRPQPARDDKVLASWNGLALAAFADAGRALGEPPFLEMATEAADFLLRELRTPDGRLRRSWKDGRAQHAAVLEDHAHLAEGLLALYEATFEERFFVAARELADLVLAHFRAEDGGFCDTADDAETLVARPRSLQDNALPSGGAIGHDHAAAPGRAHRRGPLPKCS